MSTRFDRLLQHWYPRRDDCDWVLATTVATKRSAYRKAGAMMMFNSLGQRFGLLSGGCLEDNLLNEAGRVLVHQHAAIIEYDLLKDNTGWQKGIGCGGTVRILLQPLSIDNNFLGLVQVHLALQQKNNILYLQRVDKPSLQWEVSSLDTPTVDALPAMTRNYAHVIRRQDQQWLATAIFPSPHLLIIGGGIDAQPLAKLADDIGWQVSVTDERSAYAKAVDFPTARVVNKAIASLCQSDFSHAPDAIVIMTHNLTLDASALKFAWSCSAAYVGLLGPAHRVSGRSQDGRF